MAYNQKRPYFDKYMTVESTNITVATASAFCSIVAQGEVISFSTVLRAAITGADETLQLYKNGADTGYDITVTQSGSAAGDVDTKDIPSGAVPVVAGDYLTIVSANASGGDAKANVTYVIREA